MSFATGNVSYINNLYSLYSVVCKMAKEKNGAHWILLKDKIRRKLDEECVEFIKYDNELLEGKKRFGTDVQPPEEQNPFNLGIPAPKEVVMSCKPDTSE